MTSGLPHKSEHGPANAVRLQTSPHLRTLAMTSRLKDELVRDCIHRLFKGTVTTSSKNDTCLRDLHHIVQN